MVKTNKQKNPNQRFGLFPIFYYNEIGSIHDDSCVISAVLSFKVAGYSPVQTPFLSNY